MNDEQSLAQEDEERSGSRGGQGARPASLLSQPSRSDAPVTTCAICENEYWFRWSDTHGIAACGTCGLPYRLYHYENDVRVERAPEIAVRAEWVEVGRRYWNETQRRTFPAAFDIMRGRGGCTYSGATEADCEDFSAWLDAHPELIPATAEGSQP